jgi:hypothetical protein
LVVGLPNQVGEANISPKRVYSDMIPETIVMISDVNVTEFEYDDLSYFSISLDFGTTSINLPITSLTNSTLSFTTAQIISKSASQGHPLTYTLTASLSLRIQF